MKKIILTILLVLVLQVVGLAIFVYTGTYNVSTSNHDTPFINWWLDAGVTRSVKAHASNLSVPDLDNPAKIQEGFKHFNKMCVGCHGAPGKRPGEIAKGLWPEAPYLVMTISDWTPAQVFWIIRNGIKFTAMPGWNPTHSDDQIWAITAFLEKLPKLSPADYSQMETNTVKSANSTDQPGEPAPK